MENKKLVKVEIRHIDVNKVNEMLANHGVSLKFDDNLAMVGGTRGYIITEDDFCHVIVKSQETTMIGVGVEVSVEELTKCLGEEVDVRRWGHYFGIKARVEQNYLKFQKSLKKIGAKVELPEWKVKEGR